MGLAAVLGEKPARAAGWLDGKAEAVVWKWLSKVFGLCWYLKNKTNNTMN